MRGRPGRDGDQAAELIQQAMWTGNGAMLDRGIALVRRAIDTAGADDPRRPEYLSNLGAALQTRFRRIGRVADLTEAIEASRGAVRASSGARRAWYLSNLGGSLRLLFEQTGNLADLTEAIEAGRGALKASRSDDPDRCHDLSNLGGALYLSFKETGQLADLTEAVGLLRAAVQAVPADHPERPTFVSNLSRVLLARFGRTGEVSDLTEAIEAGRAALWDAPLGHPGHPLCLANLGEALRQRYARLGQLTDITEAVDMLRRAAQVAPIYLSDLGGAYLAWFHQSGELPHLTEAVNTLRAAMAATPADRPDHYKVMSNLGDALRVRFAAALDPADVAEAIDLTRAALRGIPAGHPDRAAALYNLSVAQWERFVYGDQIRVAPGSQSSDLAEAIESLRAAKRAIPADHPGRARILSMLGLALRVRSERMRIAADLAEAIEVGRAAVEAAPPGHPERAGYLSSLATSLLVQSEQGGQADVLAEAIEVGRAAVEAAPSGHPERAGYLSDLGTSLQTKFEWTGDAAVLDEAFCAWREAVGLRSGGALARLTAAVLWGRLAAEHKVATEAEMGFGAAIELLPLLAWHGLERRSRLDYLSRWAGLAGDAAACAINAGHPDRAVELLEQGRTVLWTQVLNLRGDLDDLRDSHPDLARRLDAVRTELDHSEDVPAFGGRQLDDRIRHADQWDRIVAEVRTRPGFASFLRSPSFAELTGDLGDRTVVIVNISHYRCDALAVAASGVRVIPLPAITHQIVAERAQCWMRALEEQGSEAHQAIGDLLAWLWDTVASPILDTLGYAGQPAAGLGSWPRLWWCPTGVLTALPLHAAGRHDPDSPGAAVLDRVVSSYTPALGALHRARAVRGPGARVLLVTMPTTGYLPGGAPLHGVTREAEVVADCFPGAVTQRAGMKATKAAVAADLATHAYAHFACHGGVDPGAPAESGLCLADGRLSIEELSRLDLPPDAARLAFLSACDTGSPRVTLLDEAITMAAATQLAGFRHVIATLWAIGDRLAAAVAGDFYRTMVPAADDRLDPALALHAVVRELRGRGRSPVQWAAYVHTGP